MRPLSILGIVLLVFAAIAAVTGWGLWSLKEWARVTQIVLAALGILRTFFSIMSVFTHGHVFGIPFSLLWLAYYGWVIYYLIQPEVKAAFGQKQVAAYVPPSAS